MSLLTAISNSLSGLSAVQAEMQVVSSNVSNAGRSDYTRKTIILSSNSAGNQGTGGVSVAGYGRAESTAMEKLLRLSLANSGLRSTQSEYADRVQTVLGSSSDDPLLTSSMSDFANAWRSLAAAPEDSTRKQEVILAGENLSREITRIATALDQIKTDLKSDMVTATDTLNSSLKRIEDLNNQIVSATSAGQSTAELKDLRDTEVRKIAELVNINVYQRDQDRISIYTPGGAALLDVTAAQYQWNGTAIQTTDGVDMSSVLSGGKIEGYLGMLEQSPTSAELNDPGKATIYKIEHQLDSLVDLLTNASGTFATAYDSATTATGEQASAFFTGTNRYSIAVNSDLTDGTTTLKSAAAAGVAADMDISSRSVTSAGLTLTNVSYTGLTDGIIYKHSQNTGYLSSQAEVYSSQKDDYTQRFQNETGVNVDEEIVRLTQLQNNYSAISRVIAAAQAMLEMLDRIGS